MAVHQLLHRVAQNEPAAHRAAARRALLRRAGYSGNLFGVEVDPQLEALAWPHTALRVDAGDVVLYAHDRPSPLAGRLEHVTGPAAVWFEGFAPMERGGLDWARAQLAGMGRTIRRAVAPLPSLAGVLSLAGFSDVQVVAPWIERRRDGPGRPGATVVVQPAAGRPEELAALARELRAAISGVQVRVLEGGEPALDAFEGAAVLVTLEEQPVLDAAVLGALARDVAVLAFATPTAVELLGGAGIAFAEKRLAAVAELCGELIRNERAHQRILDGQRRRADALSAEVSEGQLARVISRWSDRPRPTRSRAKRPKVAIVTQRYGEVTGGAELHARKVVEKLAPHWDLTVLTSCARDHLTWDNAFPPGETEVDDVRVLRFPTVRSRKMAPFNVRSRALFDRPHRRLEEEAWIADGGPLVPGLLEHVERHRDQFDAFVTFTYLYAPTAWGVPLVADRALVVPTAHDEPPLRFAAYSDVFERAAALLCNTPEEAALIRDTFPSATRLRVVGVGIDAPKHLDPDRFRRRHQLREPYLLYLGRIERGKGIDELVRMHQQLRRANRAFPELVLAGERSFRVEGEGVRLLGRVSELDKWDGLAGATAVVVPSRWESLSLLTLEAFAVGTPVIANARSPVLRGQIERSGGGFTYDDAASLARGVEAVAGQRAELAARARSYARRHQWSKVVDAYREELERIRRTSR